MTDNEFWSKFQKLYDDIENDRIILKDGVMINKFDDNEIYTDFVRRSIGYLLLLGKKGNYQAQVIFNTFLLDNMHLMLRVKEIYEKLINGLMKDGSQFTDGMFMKAYLYKHINDIAKARRGYKNVINEGADFVYNAFINNYSIFNWEEKEGIYNNKIEVKQKVYKD